MAIDRHGSRHTVKSRLKILIVYAIQAQYNAIPTEHGDNWVEYGTHITDSTAKILVVNMLYKSCNAIPT